MDLAPPDTTKPARTRSTSPAPSTETGKVSSSSPRRGECLLFAACCPKMMLGEILFTPSLFHPPLSPPSHSVPLYSRKNVINAFRYHRFAYFPTSLTSFHLSSVQLFSSHQCVLSRRFIPITTHIHLHLLFIFSFFHAVRHHLPNKEPLTGARLADFKLRPCKYQAAALRPGDEITMRIEGKPQSGAAGFGFSRSRSPPSLLPS